MFQGAKREVISRNHSLPHRLNILHFVAGNIRHSRRPVGIHSFYTPHRFLLGFDSSVRISVCCNPLLSLWTGRIPMPHSQHFVTAIVRVVFRFDKQFPRFSRLLRVCENKALVDAVTYRLYMKLISLDCRLRILLWYPFFLSIKHKYCGAMGPVDRPSSGIISPG